MTDDIGIVGGLSGLAALENSVTIRGGTTTHPGRVDVTGGFGDTLVEGNTVTIDLPTGDWSEVTGGSSGGSSSASNAHVSKNTVTVNGGKALKIYGGESPLGKAQLNTVTLSGTEVGRVFGGRSNKDAYDNTVTINSGRVNTNLVGGHSISGVARTNTVVINDGVIGGLVTGGKSVNSNATHNTVVINGGGIYGQVTGGWSGGLYAFHNRVIVKGNPTFGVNAGLYGGVADEDGNARTGNTLELHTKDITASYARNFEYLHFYLPGASIANDDTVLTLTYAGKDGKPGGADIRGSKIGVKVAGSSSTLAVGNHVDLIHTTKGPLLTDDTLTNNLTGMQGVSLIYNFALSKPDANTLRATVGAGSGGSVSGGGIGTVETPVTTGAETFTYTGTAAGTYDDSSQVSLKSINGVNNSVGPKNLANVTGNKATINFTDAAYTVAGDVYAGAGSGEVKGNKLTLTDGIVRGSAYGGMSSDGSAKQNIVEMAQGTVKKLVGGSSASGSATDNTVSIKGGTFASFGSVYGGQVTSGSGAATNNRVIISGKPDFVSVGDLRGTLIYGGETRGGDARTGNTLELHTKDISVRNIANFENLHFYLQGTGADAIAHGDTVLTLTNHSQAATARFPAIPGGADIRGSRIGVKVAGSSSTLAVGNHVDLIHTTGGPLLTDATLTNNLSGMQGVSLIYNFALSKPDANTLRATVGAGGSAATPVATPEPTPITPPVATDTGSGVGGSSNNNFINIVNQTLGNSVHGGLHADTNAAGTASNNTINIRNSTIAGSVVAGFTNSTVSDNSANGNTINIYGGKLLDDIAVGVSSHGDARNNTLRLYRDENGNNPILGENRNLIGGMRGLSAESTGNTLELHTTGLRTGGIFGFQRLYFYLPPSVKNGDTALTLTDAGTTEIDGAEIGVGVKGGPARLFDGDKITLIHKEAGTLTTDTTLTNNVSAMQGVSLRYTFALSQVANDLIATLTSGGITEAEKAAEIPAVRLNPQTKSLLEGKLGGLAFLTQGADYLAQEGMDKAAEAANSGTAVFGGINAGNVKHKSGSHVDVSGINLLVGVAGNIKNTAGNFTLGGFIEAGDGDYDSFNSFVDADPVNGGGDNRYYGVGLLGRQTFANNVYAEGSVRAGRLEHDYKGNFSGTAASYDQSRTYYGAHLGLGYKQTLGKGELDTYAQGLWTRQKGGSFDVLGDPYRVSDIDSTRARLGVRYAYAVNPDWLLKTGASWEYEFDGKAQGSVHGFQITRPELKGSSGTLELGMSYRPQQSKKFSLDVGLQGHVGKREGVTGNITMKYAF